MKELREKLEGLRKYCIKNEIFMELEARFVSEHETENYDWKI